MNLLARARGLQERIRPCYLASIYTQGNVRAVEGEACPARAREVLLVSHHGGSHRPAFIYTSYQGEGVPPCSPSPLIPLSFCHCEAFFYCHCEERSDVAI